MANIIGTITAADSASSVTTGLSSQALITGTPTAGSFVSVVVPDCSTAVVTLSGTWSATLVAEQSSDGNKSWVTVGMTPIGKTTPLTSFTVNGAAYTTMAGSTNFRIRCASGGFVSGTVNVNINVSYAIFISSASGAGSGSVTSVSSPNSTITVGSPTTTPTVDINLGNANTWTALQTTTLTDSNLNNALTCLTLDHETSGTKLNIVAGFGSSISLLGTDSTTASQTMGAINTTWISPTHGSTTSQIALQTATGSGLTTGLTVGSGIASATAGLIVGGQSSTTGGLWSSGVTPSTSNYALAALSTATGLNAVSGGTVQLSISATTFVTLSSTALTHLVPSTITVGDATTNAANAGLTLQHNCTTLANTVAGFGTGIAFNLGDTTTANQSAGVINATWLVATHASRSSQLLFQTVSNAGALSTGLTVGSGISGATAGLIVGGLNSGQGAIWSNLITPGTTNYSLACNNNSVNLNAASGGTANIAVAGTAVITVAAASVTLAQPTTTTITAIGTAQTAGDTQVNTTVAANGAQQNSPMSVWQGQGWQTTTPASESVAFGVQVVPVQGTTAPTGQLVFSSNVNAAGFVQQLTIGSAIAGATSGWIVGGLNTAASGIWLSSNSPTTSNYVLAANTSNATVLNAPSGGSLNFDINASSLMILTSTTFQIPKVTTYNAVATAGIGVPAIYASANITAQSSNATITSYANPAADGDYEVSATLNITVATGVSTSINVTYTDVNNAAQTLVMPLQKAGGTGGTYLSTGLAITTGDYTTPVHKIRVKASTTITILTAAGTFTGVTYSASGTIKQTT